ncbi:thermonuclease family protein [Aminobacter sp. NyZ550]|nr:thermonuclease family protein [Aminobacter sp. NyZ550]WAX97309.1 thermonuclease family protein [Aminobacter sp. NyZ550]
MLTIALGTVLACVQLVAVDGDTIKCNGENMRLIGDGVPFKSGIDTPEIGSHAKCARENMLGQEAKKRLAQLLRSPGVRIEDTGVRDKTEKRRRLVRMRLGDGQLAEHILLEEGYAVRWAPKMKRSWCG